MTAYKVCTLCMTYNQSGYITDTLDGFCKQKTDFPFVCCIIDDASTDGEQEVIKNYFDSKFIASDNPTETEHAHILFGRNKLNPNCHFAILFLKENHFQKGRNNLKFNYIKRWSDVSDYQAICEGDDYWVDPLKLQKQTNHLDANPDCMLCCSDAIVDSPTGDSAGNADYGRDTIIPASDMIEKGGAWICTCTCLFRPEVITRHLELECTNQCHVGDWCWQMLSVILGNAYFLGEKTACYRFVSSGSWTRRITDIDPMKRLPEIGSITDMLLGLDEFSNRRFHQSFANSLRKYLHTKALLFCRKGSYMRLFKKRCRKAWTYLSMRQRLLLDSYRFGFIEKALVYCKQKLH